MFTLKSRKSCYRNSYCSPHDKFFKKEDFFSNLQARRDFCTCFSFWFCTTDCSSVITGL